MIENLNGYIYDSFFKIKKNKGQKKKNIAESKIVHFFYRIKSGNTTILIMSLEDFEDFLKGTEFDIAVSSNPFTNILSSDEFIAIGQVKSCREKPTKENDHYVYSVRSTTIQNKGKINEVTMNLD
jgi:hypothetical protein